VFIWLYLIIPESSSKDAEHAAAWFRGGDAPRGKIQRAQLPPSTSGTLQG